MLMIGAAGRSRDARRAVDAATLGSLHTIPVAGLVLLLGIDRFLNEARAITNLVGNGLATIAIAKWEGEFDEARWREATGDRRGVGRNPVVKPAN